MTSTKIVRQFRMRFRWAHGLNEDEAFDSVRWTRNLGWLLIGLQLVGMLVLSTIQYGRDNLDFDFAHYAQAQWLIAHGTFDPRSSVLASQFWRVNGEFIMWPLALLYFPFRSPIILLWVQDLVVALTGVVAVGWITDLLRSRSRRLSSGMTNAIVIGSALLLVANPWAYETVAFDIHFESFAALFVLLVGRDLWARKTKQMWRWVPLVLLSQSLGGLYLCGVGLSALVARRDTRRLGLALILIGLAYTEVLARVGVTFGGHQVTEYGYLLGTYRGSFPIQRLPLGLVTHLGTVAHIFRSRLGTAAEFLLPAGFIGLLSPWALGMAVVVFLLE